MNQLQELFFRNVKSFAGNCAIETVAGESITYDALGKLADEYSVFLKKNGIEKGCRVVIMAPKSISKIALLLAILKNGAAYIPIDIETPEDRLKQILENLNPHAFISTREYFSTNHPEKSNIAINGEHSICFYDAKKHDKNLAFILYTSGSTGAPKGVCITHENALSFCEWSFQTFALSEKDRFSSIAPFHFDLSVFDLYVGLGCGGTVVLMDVILSKNPRLLGITLAEKKISVIYATPSLFSLLLNFGQLEKLDFSTIRLVLFAGEIFPVKHLHRLMDLWKSSRFYNLYGPTETNVCCSYEIPRPYEENRTEPYPIGKICSQLEGKITTEGELLISGPNVTSGYWQRPELDKAFPVYEGKRYYKTGDKIEISQTGELVYSGRLDRMIKKRGYRIEPEEIEAVLTSFPEIMEAAVVGTKDKEGFTFLRAFIALQPSEERSLIKIKKQCLNLLPSYMIPEEIVFMEILPKTTSGKIDLNSLNAY
ncbi:N/A [soil metagenome]